nr:protein tpx2 [Ipomoea batatas]
MESDGKSTRGLSHCSRNSENVDPNVSSPGLKVARSPLITKSAKKAQKLASESLNPVASPSPQKKIRQRKFVVAKRNSKREDANSAPVACKCGKGGVQKCLCVAYESLRASHEEFFTSRRGVDDEESVLEEVKMRVEAEIGSKDEYEKNGEGIIGEIDRSFPVNSMESDGKSTRGLSHCSRNSENVDPNVSSPGLKVARSPLITKSAKKAQKLASESLNPVASPSPQKKIRQRKFVVAKRNSKREDANSAPVACKCGKGGVQKCLCVAYESLRASHEEFFTSRRGVDDEESVLEEVKMRVEAEIGSKDEYEKNGEGIIGEIVGLLDPLYCNYKFMALPFLVL